jgi:hypothetical protein
MKKPLLFRNGLKLTSKAKISLRGNNWRSCKKNHVVPLPCNQVCGLIFQPCDGTRQTYFTSLVPTGMAVVRIRNDAACRMRAIFTTRCRQFEQTVGQGQQVAVALKSLYQLSIECGDCEENGPPCRGQYEIQWATSVRAAN